MSDHTHDHELYMGIVVETKPYSIVEVRGEIPLSTVQAYRTKALHHIGKGIELPGFRKGHVPTDLLVAHVGELRILEETAELVLGHGYGHLVEEHSLRPVARPSITLTKLAPKNPIAFTIEVPVYPNLTLPNYAQIAHDVVQSHGDITGQEVTETEFSDELVRVRGIFQEKPSKEGEETQLPELTDDMVKKLGDFADVADFTAKLKVELGKAKVKRAREKRRIAIADALLEKTNTDLPEAMITHELERMQYEFEHTLKQMGASWNDYLTHQKKTDDEVLASWRDDAKKRVLLDLLLMEIATKESIAPNKESVEKVVASIVAQHPDVNVENVRSHITASHINDAVFAWLESR